MILKDKIVLMNIMQIIVHIYQLMMDQLEIIFVLKKKMYIITYCLLSHYSHKIH